MDLSVNGLDAGFSIEMTRDNLTYLLGAWFRMYLKQKEHDELLIRSAKIIDVLRMKNEEGILVASESTVNTLEEAFNTYVLTYAVIKLSFISNGYEYEEAMSRDEEEEVKLEKPKYKIKCAFDYVMNHLNVK